MLLVADGIDDPAATRVQGAGLAVHIRNEVVRDVPESVPLAGTCTTSEQNKNFPSILLEGTFPSSCVMVSCERMYASRSTCRPP